MKPTAGTFRRDERRKRRKKRKEKKKRKNVLESKRNNDDYSSEIRRMGVWSRGKFTSRGKFLPGRAEISGKLGKIFGRECAVVLRCIYLRGGRKVEEVARRSKSFLTAKRSSGSWRPPVTSSRREGAKLSKVGNEEFSRETLIDSLKRFNSLADRELAGDREREPRRHRVTNGLTVANNGR